MKSLRTLSALLLLVFLAAPCEADEAERLAALLRATGETSDVLGFLRGLRGLGDIDLDQTEVRRAVSLVDAPIRGPLADLLAPTRALRIRNGKVQISRSSETVVAMGAGTLKLGRRVQFQLGASGPDTLLTSPRGIKVAESGGGLYPLKRVLFTRVNGRPIATVTAGIAVFVRTVTVPLPEPTPVAIVTAPRAEPRAGCRKRGLVGALGGETPAPADNTATELRVGDRGEDVADLQREINEFRRARGLEPIDEDGIFGPGTEAARREYQEACK